MSTKKITKVDWTGNSQTAYVSLGASNHSNAERATRDLYATPECATEMLLELERFSHKIWEPACGLGHISRVLEAHGHEVRSTDIEQREYGKGGIDFLDCKERDLDVDICTNPPYKFAQEFVEKAIEVVALGHKVAMFLKLTFLEWQSRWRLFRDNPPIRVWVSCRRLVCAKNGDFDATAGSAVAYAWFVWEKGYKGEPAIRWFNTPASSAADGSPSIPTQPQLSI